MEYYGEKGQKIFKVEQYPVPKCSGMSVPNMDKGVKVTHLPTGNVVICQHLRSQHKNKDTAIAALELMADI